MCHLTDSRLASCLNNQRFNNVIVVVVVVVVTVLSVCHRRNSLPANRNQSMHKI